jgi:hypothetical protein
MGIVVQRKEVYDPSTTKYVDEELPTVTVKGYGREIHVGAGSALATFSGLGGGTEMRLTFYRVSASTVPIEFYMRDRGGTFDVISIQTKGEEVAHAGPMDPLHVVRGTFEMGLLNTGTAGTFVASYEGVVRFSGTETWE